MADRQDNAYISVSVTDKQGTLLLGRWEGRSGGESDSASTTYAKAGMAGRKAQGGRQEVANVIVKRLFDSEMQSVIDRLRAGAGKIKMQVSEQPEDDEGNKVGKMETWTGKLKKVHVADRDTETASAETLELEMVVEGEVVVSN